MKPGEHLRSHVRIQTAFTDRMLADPLLKVGRHVVERYNVIHPSPHILDLRVHYVLSVAQGHFVSRTGEGRDGWRRHLSLEVVIKSHGLKL